MFVKVPSAPTYIPHMPDIQIEQFSNSELCAQQKRHESQFVGIHSANVFDVNFRAAANIVYKRFFFAF